MFWPKLPAELQLMILEYVARLSYKDGETLVGYARVTSDWQFFFEGQTMRSIQVKRSELVIFRYIFRFKRRRKCLRQIGLVLELPDARVPLYCEGDTRHDTIGKMWAIAAQGTTLTFLEPEAWRRNRSFTRSVRALLYELSTWKGKHVWHKGIGLEIIAKSRSYWQRKARELRPSIDPVVFGIHSFNTLEQERILEAADTDFHFALDLHFQSPLAPTLPQVQVVTSLSVLRKSIRCFHPQALGQIMNSLPALKTFIWEFRPRVYWMMESRFQTQLSIAIKSWPATLSDVRISQLQPFDSHVRHILFLWPLTLDMADFSQNLSCLSLRYCIDAFEFLRIKARLWPNLQHLTLWSKQLIVNELPSCDRNLLRLTPYALCAMPRLQSLIMYNRGGDYTGLLICEISRDTLILKLRCSWPFEVGEDTIKLWLGLAGGTRRFKWSFRRLHKELAEALISNTLSRKDRIERCMA